MPPARSRPAPTRCKISASPRRPASSATPQRRRERRQPRNGRPRRRPSPCRWPASPSRSRRRPHAGNKHFEIRLDPPELGRIDVKLDVDRDGNVSTRLVVDRADTLDLLKRDASTLERALQQAGLKTSDNALEFSLRQQAFAQRRHAAQNGRAAGRAGRRSGAARGDAARLRPAARAGRRPRHQSVRTTSWQRIIPADHIAGRLRPATGRASTTSSTTGDRQRHHRRQLPDLPDAADDAAQEPEPARSARHQPVHRAARAVRAGRAAAQVERPALHAGVAAADRAEHRGARIRRPDRRRRRRDRAARQRPAPPGISTVPKPATGTITITSATGQNVYTGTYSMNAGTSAVRLGRQGRQRPAMARRQLHDHGHRAGRQRPGGRGADRDRSAWSTPPISRQTRRRFRSPDRTTRSTKSSA